MMTFESWDQFFQTLLITIAPIIASGIIALITRGFSLLGEKTQAIKDERVRSALFTAQGELERLTSMVVTSLNQTLVEGLKAQNGSKLSAADALRIKNEALSRIKHLLSSEAQQILQERKGDIEELILHLIEEAVSNNRTIQPIEIAELMR